MNIFFLFIVFLLHLMAKAAVKRPDLSTLINEKIHSLDEEIDLFNISPRNGSESEDNEPFSQTVENSEDQIDRFMQASLFSDKNGSIDTYVPHRINGKRPLFPLDNHSDHRHQLVTKTSLVETNDSALPPKVVTTSPLEVHSDTFNVRQEHVLSANFVLSNANSSLEPPGSSSSLDKEVELLLPAAHNLSSQTTMSPSVNYNQQDPLNPLQIIAHPIQNLVLRSFEGYRRLLKNSQLIEKYIIDRLKLPKWTTIRRLDPLLLPEPLFFEHRDPKTPMIGKLKFTFEDVHISGLSNFKVENLSNQGRTLFFKHRIPQLDSIANYTIDYHLFDEIPLRISEGQLKASVPNAYIKGSFKVLPDILNVWFKIANLNLTGWIDDVDMNVFPHYIISDRFKIERSTINKMNAAVRAMMPDVIEYLKITYNKAIEMKMV